MVRKGLPDMLTSEQGLKEGREGVSLVFERVCYQHCGTAGAPASHLSQEEGLVMSDPWKVVDQVRTWHLLSFASPAGCQPHNLCSGSIIESRVDGAW